MSSLRIVRRALARSGTVALLCLGLAACFKPLYGPTASGAMLQDVLAAIKVEQVGTPVGQERIGHDLRSELVYMLNGSGVPVAPRYRLVLTLNEAVGTPIVNSALGRVDTATLVVTTSYILSTLDGRIVTTGVSRGAANYNRDAQRFASVRAARDADQRVARMVADEIRTRLSAILSVAP